MNWGFLIIFKSCISKVTNVKRSGFLIITISYKNLTFAKINFQNFYNFNLIMKFL
jgi:hypothetical protein